MWLFPGTSTAKLHHIPITAFALCKGNFITLPSFCPLHGKVCGPGVATLLINSNVRSASCHPCSPPTQYVRLRRARYKIVWCYDKEVWKNQEDTVQREHHLFIESCTLHCIYACMHASYPIGLRMIRKGQEKLHGLPYWAAGRTYRSPRDGPEPKSPEVLLMESRTDPRSVVQLIGCWWTPRVTSMDSCQSCFFCVVQHQTSNIKPHHHSQWSSSDAGSETRHTLSLYWIAVPKIVNQVCL